MKIVLIIEDLPEEQVRAKAAVIAAGFRPAVAETLADANRLWKSLTGKIAGVLTDLHFPERSLTKTKTAANPCGLAVVTRALLEQMPVSICSNADNHFIDYFKYVVSDLEQITGQKIPFTNDKNWKKAVASFQFEKEAE